jgi:ABC-2 type transport system ATP-binding protein
MTTPLLEVLDLRKCYGPITALDGVTFSVDRGELFGLLGPNGAGKSTLLNILSSLTEPNGGEAFLLGKRFLPPDRADRDPRRFIGIVPQELALYEQLTARENLLFFGELFGLRAKDLRQRVLHLLAAVGLDGRADHRVATFSGGMKRRLNFACGLVHEPELLLLDEPTVGVDPQSRNLIFEEVRRLNAAGMTILYTSHYMEEVEALCSRIGIIDGGRLKACDTLERLLQRLRGLIRFRVSAVTPALRQRLWELPDCEVRERTGNEVEVECGDVKGTLIRLVAVLNEADVELVNLETKEPSLERVFLHLTGRGLRD